MRITEGMRHAGVSAATGAFKRTCLTTNKMDLREFRALELIAQMRVTMYKLRRNIETHRVSE